MWFEWVIRNEKENRFFEFTMIRTETPFTRVLFFHFFSFFFSLPLPLCLLSCYFWWMREREKKKKKNKKDEWDSDKSIHFRQCWPPGQGRSLLVRRLFIWIKDDRSAKSLWRYFFPPLFPERKGSQRLKGKKKGKWKTIDKDVSMGGECCSREICLLVLWTDLKKNESKVEREREKGLWPTRKSILVESRFSSFSLVGCSFSQSKRAGCWIFFFCFLLVICLSWLLKNDGLCVE